ncbi:MAG: aldehyde dehydrogenase family protein [Myxococcota bacterium]|mgnify:CR=1 FL=1|jgi:succinate-semialdehyde dehydrogenase/glutarate-semialdehyde dehydrogenase|nr:aldehyde dehydrogenase [Deltaproteobacteria bacterium]MCP4240342.1 aldehyde dehydrogenase family protein [bacterium]MDP6075587.1 aldehyde dehydrogenase family protein [Myxococcota bacterium]MDP6242709.1 aldehyde dehydrogenase family protein [Myxococcota bacterium]MDP7074518.1 aldehyde dehydrogenase family protein [Myxococcota bacterium]
MAIVEAAESSGPRRRLRALSPATLEPIGEFDCATPDDVRGAVERARKAQAGWAQLDFDARAKYLYALCQQVVARQDDIIELVIRETGKARNDAIAMEVFAPCDALTFYAKNAKKFLRSEKPRIHGVMGFMKKLRIIYKPLGVVGLITPWNGPVALSLVPMAQALMAGNAIVQKPSEVTPFSALLVKEMTEAAGFPPDLYQVVQGDGETGAALVEADVDKISFTGSVATGRKVGAACAQRLIPFTLELGGKDAMIVCADADLDRAAQGAVNGSCMNTGHYCCGTERIYVVGDVYDEFVEKVTARTRELRQSDVGESDVGAVFWDEQMKIIESHMDDARAKGANVLVGGRRNPNLKGLYFEPTVVTDVTHDMDLMTRETFGPIVSIMKVADEEEAISRANDSEYGLNGNVWTTDTEKGLRLAERLDTGGACVNDMAITYGIHEAPFGGVKASGLGQVNGPIGLRSYCHIMPLTADRKGKGKVQGGYPYTRKGEDGMQKAVKIFFGTRLARWFS